MTSSCGEPFLLPRPTWSYTISLFGCTLALAGRLQDILFFMLSFLFRLLHSEELYSSKKADTKPNRNSILPLNLSPSKASAQSCAERVAVLMLLLLLSYPRGRGEALRGSNMLTEKTHQFRRPRSMFVDRSRSLNQSSSTKRHPQFMQNISPGALWVSSLRRNFG